MKILIFSDSHGKTEPMISAVRRHKPDMVIHLGDYSRDVFAVMSAFPGLKIHSVEGNCDAFLRSGHDAQTEKLIKAEETLLFITHGHRYSVKTGLGSLVNTAMCAGADAVLYGHTHIPDYDEYEGLVIINPGAAGGRKASYGLLEISGKEMKYSQLFDSTDS